MWVSSDGWEQPFRTVQTTRDSESPACHLTTFPWYTTRHVCTSVFPFKFPSKFCVNWWLKNIRAAEHAGINSQSERNKTCKGEDVKVSSSRHIISILQYSYRPLLLMHMSGMTAGPPKWISLWGRATVFSFVAVQLKHLWNFMMLKW